MSVLCYQRGAEDVEADYTRFCKLTKPFLTTFVIISVSALVEGFWTARYDRIISKWCDYFVFSAIVGIRGRALVPALLRGRLSWMGMAIVGVACGVGHVVLSMLIGLPFLNHLMFDHRWADGGVVTLFIDSLAGPIYEETFYQVALQTALQRFGPAVAVIGTTLPFWAIHLWHGSIPFIAAVIYTLLGCLIFGVIRQTTKSTGAAIIAHSVGNIILGMVHPA